MTLKYWPYLLVFEPAFATRQDVQDFLDTLPEVSFWHSCLPNCVFLTARISAGELAKRLESKFDITQNQKFLVVEVHTDRQGRLTPQAWRVFNNPSDPRIPSKNKK